MHTFKDRTIDTEKLEVMVDDEGKPMTMFEVYKNMAKYYKREDPDKRLPVNSRESYNYNKETGEWEVIGYNYSEDYITTLTEREKEKEEKNYNNYDQKIEEAVEKFESKIKEEKKEQDQLENEIEVEK